MLLEKEKKLLDLLNEYGDEYARLKITPNKNEQQKKRFEELYKKLLNSGIMIYDTHSDNWLGKLKDRIKSRVAELDSVTAELRKANSEYYQAQVFLSELEKISETNFDRIKNQEHFRKQIEMYHQGFEPQEDGTFKQETAPTLERNAELAYLEAERRRKFEIQRITEKQEIELRRRNSYYSR